MERRGEGLFRVNEMRFFFCFFILTKITLHQIPGKDLHAMSAKADVLPQRNGGFFFFYLYPPAFLPFLVLHGDPAKCVR